MVVPSQLATSTHARGATSWSQTPALLLYPSTATCVASSRRVEQRGGGGSAVAGAGPAFESSCGGVAPALWTLVFSLCRLDGHYGRADGGVPSDSTALDVNPVAAVPACLFDARTTNVLPPPPPLSPWLPHDSTRPGVARDCRCEWLSCLTSTTALSLSPPPCCGNNHVRFHSLLPQYADHFAARVGVSCVLTPVMQPRAGRRKDRATATERHFGRRQVPETSDL